MDTLTSSPVLFIHAKLFKQILRRSVRAVVSDASHAGVYKHQQPQKLQISRCTEAAKSAQRSLFLELISVPEAVRFDLCSVLENKVGRSSFSPEFPYALAANSGKCIPEGGESLGPDQQRPSRRRFIDKKAGLNSYSRRKIVGIDRNAKDAKDAAGEGIFAHEVDETSSEELGTRSQKEISRNLGRGDASEVLTWEDETAEDERFMLEALKEARKATRIGEVPVGAVVVQNGRIIARAYNRVEAEGDPTAHAEMLCIRSASKTKGDWRLTDATMYVTMEPCPMCAGAMLQARLKRVVWGARNNLLGADGSWVSLFPNSNTDMKGQAPHVQPQHPFHKTLEVRRQILTSDCSMIMRSFFRSRRKGESPAAKRKPALLSFELWVLFRWLLG